MWHSPKKLWYWVGLQLKQMFLKRTKELFSSWDTYNTITRLPAGLGTKTADVTVCKTMCWSAKTEANKPVVKRKKVLRMQSINVVSDLV